MKSFLACATTLALSVLTSAFPSDTSSYIYPATHALYHSSSGKLEYDVPWGNVTRTPRSGNSISTLVVFYFTDSTEGKTCELHFETDNAANGPNGYAWHPSNAQLDVFRSSVALEENKQHTSNFRDVPMGRLTPVAGGLATTYMGSMKFRCPEKAKGPASFEFVPVGDEIEVGWSKNGDGPYITFY